jgi:hypothetical protein
MDIKRLLRLAAAASLCPLVLSLPAQARDRVIARDTAIQSIYALGGDLVYHRSVKPPAGAWMRWFDGRPSRARGIPQDASAGAIGRDARGRTVLTLAVSGKWFAYDLARDRARPVHGLPARCATTWLSVWRRSMAYTALCKDDAESGMFVRQGRHTRKISSDPYGNDLVFRGGALAGIFDTGLDDFVVVRYAANGKPCTKLVEPSYAGAEDPNGWWPSDLWIGGGSLTWMMGHWYARPNFALLSAKLPSRCAAPAPVGRYPFTPETTTVGALAVDGRHVFYADGETLRSHLLPPRPSYEAPRNDAFRNAEELAGDLPLSVTGDVGYATVQPGEPLGRAKHTVWYAYRPETSGTVYAWVDGACTQSAFVCNGAYRYRVYTGDSVDKLTLIAPSGNSTRIDAVAGKTYWIVVGAARPEPKYQPFVLHVSPSPSAY